MSAMQIRDVVLAEQRELPPIGELAYQVVVAGNGTFIKTEDSRMEALVPVSLGTMWGLVEYEPYARLKVERIPESFLYSVLDSARRHLPDECLYQFCYSRQPGGLPRNVWRCVMPPAQTNPASITYVDQADAVVDLHSHARLQAFFSETDNGDEQGLRFYAVVGRIDSPSPEIRVRVGVYGQHMHVPVTTVFEGPGPFADLYGTLGRSDVEEMFPGSILGIYRWPSWWAW